MVVSDLCSHLLIFDLVAAELRGRQEKVDAGVGNLLYSVQPHFPELVIDIEDVKIVHETVCHRAGVQPQRVQLRLDHILVVGAEYVCGDVVRLGANGSSALAQKDLLYIGMLHHEADDVMVFNLRADVEEL